MRMRVAVLGPLQVLDERAELGVKDFRGTKPKQILQLLVIERGHTVPKERLAEGLWGEAMPRNHIATLETYVSVLRQTLQPHGSPRASVVLTERGGYRLDTDRVQIDLDEFDSAIAHAVRAEPQSALQSLKRGLSLVRGRALEDEPYADWALATRDAYTQRHVQALIDAGRLSLLTGDALGALALAKQAVGHNPLAEAGYQVLMGAAYSLWRQDEALAAFDRCRRLLADELGVDPLDETVALHLSILRHEDIAPLLPAIEVGRSSSAPPDRSPMLDRDPELKQLRSAAEQAFAGRLTVVLVRGDMGMGKTRLVETLAAELDVTVAANRCSDLESSFPYLALSLALREALPDLAANGLPGLAALLERAERAEPIDEFARLRVMESLATALSTRPPLLLVLDDVQWADPETVTTLGYLQRRCPEAKVLVVLTHDPATAPSPPLRALRPDVRVELHALSREAVEDFAGPEVYPAAGGNPSHIASWLDARARGLDEVFTPELRERIVTACWDLGPATFRLLCAASAVEQPSCTLELLSHLLEARPSDVIEQLDRLVLTRLLDEVGNGFAFRSATVRSILQGTLSPARRELLNQTAAQYGLASPRRRASDPPPAHGEGRPFALRRASDLAPPVTPPPVTSPPPQDAPARLFGRTLADDDYGQAPSA